MRISLFLFSCFPNDVNVFFLTTFFIPQRKRETSEPRDTIRLELPTSVSSSSSILLAPDQTSSSYDPLEKAIVTLSKNDVSQAISQSNNHLNTQIAARYKKNLKTKYRRYYECCEQSVEMIHPRG